MRLPILFFFLAVACKQQPVHSEEANLNERIIEEHVVDSVSLGKRGRFKIDIQQVRDSSDVYVEFVVFKKLEHGWHEIQSYKSGKDGISPLEPELSDFNGDELNDLTFRSGTPARPSNEIRTLFLFDNDREQLTLIRNSTDYPNLLYNEELKCIDAWLIYGGSSTVFLRVENDSLKGFADVELFGDRLTVTEIDGKGQRKILKEEPIKDLEVYTRFKNYKPLSVREEKPQAKS
jgi:hypothetical protein